MSFHENAIADIATDDAIYIRIKQKLRKARNEADITLTHTCLQEFEALSAADSSRKWLADYYVAYVLLFQTRFLSDGVKSLPNIDKAIALLQKTLLKKKDFADGYILLAALYNNKMGAYKKDLDYLLELKKERDKLLKQAWKLDKKNPRYFLVKAEGIYHTPEEFDGGPEEAKPVFEKGLKCCPPENRPETAMPDWGSVDLLFWLGFIAEEEEKLEQAISCYERLLRYEPEHQYVRDDLLPKLRAKRNHAN